MARIDVDDVFSDPDFLDSCTVVSTSVMMSQGGVPLETPHPAYPLVAVIQPDKTSMLRLADGSRLEGTIFIFTRTKLSAGTKTNDVQSRLADVVTWHGRMYVVRMSEDWSAYGVGYYRVACDLIQLNAST
jgi:hypothetical protein